MEVGKKGAVSQGPFSCQFIWLKNNIKRSFEKLVILLHNAGVKVI